MVAGVVGMVPEGLVLLTSLAFGIAAVTLARRNVLVQELPAVEVLARVDVVCLDKTGTLTEGDVAFGSTELLPAGDRRGDGDDAEVRAALGALADDENRNATLGAIAGSVPAHRMAAHAVIPFSSARKWSAATFADHGSWVIGAPEMILADRSRRRGARRADELAAAGNRVLLLGHADETVAGETLPKGFTPRALVLLEEQIRPDAAETLRYFTDQGVGAEGDLGRQPTHGRRRRAPGGNAEGSGDAYDARELPEDPEELADVLEHHSVFGRVTPQQKRSMVAALQSRGHVVAMTGDGVNDALALKDADIGVAMGSGAAATRAVAQLVLLDGKFSTMPGVVAEGRRVIANIERSANLFVTKTVYAVLLAVAVVLTGIRYPFLPRHLTIVSVFTIGIPGFVLALAPNSRRYVPGFLDRVLRFCIPAGVVAGLASLATYWLTRFEEDLPLKQARTTTALVLVVIGLWVLVILARPFNWWKALLVGSMAGCVAVILLVGFLRDFYALEMPDVRVLGEAALIAVAGIFLLEIGWRASRRFGRRRDERAAAAAAADEAAAEADAAARS